MLPANHKTLRVPAKHKTLLKKTIKNSTLVFKLLIDCWNAERPHFNNSGPHRYDGSDKECAYCCRPKDWKKSNSLFLAELLTEEIE